jgi:hypothetical protein
VAQEYVRVCPVCEQENPPEQARCACGASLAGVDFSLKRAPPPAATPPAEVAEPAATAAAAPDVVVCPHADCAQPNPPGTQRCLYCNRPLDGAAAVPVIAGARPLPAALRDEFSVVDVFPASGSEADILLVADVRSGERRVAKLYRKGIAPDFRLLAILAQAVGDTVVRVLAHGVSDGAAYELLEYIPGGTLEDLMRAGPLPKADIKRIVREIADALNGIHAHRILHRDLKPENVLIRSKSPLELALTDFGIASLAAATQHFTSAARTTKYAAPEALTGVLDTKSDWWSLGMIVLEAASGRHPFEGLNEQVMNHHLATRPIDVRGVYDDELRMLCRGLLLRDPNRRWGGDEVARWLAADPTLAVSDAADGVATVVRPYRFGQTEATSSADLALALAKHWDAACRDLARGQITRWLEQELHDYNLVRTLRDIEDQKGVSADGRLLRFLLAAAPDVPPVWRGAPVSEEAVLASARAAANGDDAEQSWLDSLYRDRALETYVAAGRAELHDLDQRWRRGWNDFVELWQAARDAEEKWRKQPRDVGGGAGAHAVSYDDLAFVASGRLELPPQRMVNGALLLAQADAGYVDALRGEIIGGLAAVSGFCPWFDALWEKAQRHPIGVVVSRQMLTHAQDDAAMEARRQAATSGARAHVFEEARDAMRERLAAVLAFVPNDDEELSAGTVTELLDALDGFQVACQNVLRLGHAGPEFDALRLITEKLSALGLAAQRALAEAEEIGGVNAIFLTPQRLVIGVAILAGALLLRVPVVILVVLAAAALAIGYRWYMGFRATEAVLSKLRLFNLHGKTFLRTGAGAPGEKANAR